MLTISHTNTDNQASNNSTAILRKHLFSNVNKFSVLPLATLLSNSFYKKKHKQARATFNLKDGKKRRKWHGPDSHETFECVQFYFRIEKRRLCKYTLKEELLRKQLF